MKITTFLFTSLFLVFASNADAQLWKKFKENTKDKISKRVQDKIENEISEDLANRAMQKVDNLYEDLWRKSYNDANDEDLSKEEFEDLLKQTGDDLNEALGELNKAADVPPSYNFNVIVDYISTDPSGDELRSEMYFSRSEGIMGILTDNNDKQSIMVMDAENDLMVIYNDINGKRTAQAIPAMFTMTSALSMTSTEAMEYRLPLKLSGRTATIAGYSSREYVGEDEESTFSMYFSNELPFDWRESYGELIKSIVPKMYDENEQKFEGMMMKSVDTNKQTGKSNYWEVKKISNMKTRILKSDFKFQGIDS